MDTTTLDPDDDPRNAFSSWDYWLKYPRATIDFSVNCIVALLLWFIFYVVVWIIVRIVRGMLKNPVLKIKDDVLNTFVMSIKFFLWIQLIPIIIGQIGIPMDSVISVITAVTFSVGIAMRGAVENFVCGILLITLTPFNQGDVVHLARSGKITGSVLGTGMSFTEVRDPDGSHIYVPNSAAYNSPIHNHTLEGKCRIDAYLPLPAHTSAQGLMKARRVMLNALANEDYILKEPRLEPHMHIKAVTEMHVIVCARVWVLPSHFYTAEFQILETVRQAFVLSGVDMTVSRLASANAHIPKFEKIKGDPTDEQDFNDVLALAAGGLLLEGPLDGNEGDS